MLLYLQDVRGDIFAFGLCMLELLTLKQLDPQHCMEVPQLLSQVSEFTQVPLLCHVKAVYNALLVTATQPLAVGWLCCL